MHLGLLSLVVVGVSCKSWYLEPVSVTKIDKKNKDRNIHSEVKQSHRVFSDVDGNRQGLKQERQQGKTGRYK